MVKEENMTKDMQGQELPPSLDFFLNWVGIRDPIQHAPVHIPEEEEELHVAWTPSYSGEEPPF